MAGAEARLVWQRAANRCFVQEDAKRAPKLACCQSSSTQSKQVDGVPTSVADMPDDQTGGFKPLDRKPSYSHLPQDARWWLQLQPSYGYHKGFSYEPMNVLEGEVENLGDYILDSPSKISKFDSLDDRSNASIHKHRNIDPELKGVYDKNALEFIEFEDTKQRSKLVEMDLDACVKPQMRNECSFEPESPWIGGEKNVPWWRTTDKDDLASLVAQRSRDYVGNCDLPPPQKMHMRRYPGVRPGTSDPDVTLLSSLESKGQTGCIPGPIVHTPRSPNSDTTHGRHRLSTDGYSPSGSDKPFSDTMEVGQVSENDPLKAQLLEALRHSQTRAREAEKVAQQVSAEKEHIIKLFFKQASQLFAYKQWFQLLQLETLYHQIRNGDPPMPTFFPGGLPWLPQKGKKLRKSWQKPSKGNRNKQGRPAHDIGTYAVAFALGLGLVGAGILLGWTVGWMFF
ncbi:hypothetical protein Tsubulata_039715 [Turnera subulata]|uniref:Uncharacterized protein n=1 Tax=Turnera subulata TaxID=218843 RepID=A0A9Q0F2B6_9ROSI|nr:hypothetical protein Tsubulata_039715 [Turnera subulata]